MQQSDKLNIGISTCLLGHQVRFDGGHKRAPQLMALAESFVDFAPLCLEVEIGLGTPRPTIQLRKGEQAIHLVTSKAPHKDLTENMEEYARGRVEALGELDGFIFKKDSPSCGMSRVPVVINDSGYREKSGTGLFASAFMSRWPLIPVEDEGRLKDAAIRENFFERVYAYRRWKQTISQQNTVQELIDFHTRHKLQLLARGAHHYRELGHLVAGTNRNNLSERRNQYISRFMEIMAIRPDRGKHINVLQHIQGYLKRKISREDKMELAQLFEAFRQRQLPLITPVTLLKRHLRHHPDDYLSRQHYLTPFPDALALRAVL